MTAGVFGLLPIRENALYLLVQSPRVIFAYWDLSEGHIKTINEHGDLYLQLHTLGAKNSPPEESALEESTLYEEVKVPFTNRWYFHSLEPGNLYFCELGIKQNGMFYPLLRSNRVQTPRLTQVEMAVDWETTTVKRKRISLSASTGKMENGVSSSVFYYRRAID